MWPDKLSNQGASHRRRTWTLEVEGHKYDLGPVHDIIANARVADEQPPEDGKSLHLVGGDNNSIVQRLGYCRGNRLPRTSPGFPQLRSLALTGQALEEEPA